MKADHLVPFSRFAEGVVHGGDVCVEVLDEVHEKAHGDFRAELLSPKFREHVFSLIVQRFVRVLSSLIDEDAFGVPLGHCCAQLSGVGLIDFELPGGPGGPVAWARLN